jgi:hypothetical protein
MRGENVKATEVHHIKEQHTANAEGFIEHFHKNNAHNLVPLCESCHQKTHHGTLKIFGYKDTSRGRILDYTDSTYSLQLQQPTQLQLQPTIKDHPEVIETQFNLQNINRERLYEGLYPHIKYSKGTWYHKKSASIRGKWKPIESEKNTIILLSDLITKLQLVIQIDLLYEMNQAKVTGDRNRLEEFMHEFENILHDPNFA